MTNERENGKKKHNEANEGCYAQEKEKLTKKYLIFIQSFRQICRAEEKPNTAANFTAKELFLNRREKKWKQKNK